MKDDRAGQQTAAPAVKGENLMIWPGWWKIVAWVTASWFSIPVPAIPQKFYGYDQIRRLAVRRKFRPFGYPTMVFTSRDDPQEEMLQAITYVAKYTGLVVLNTTKKNFVPS